MSTTLNPQKNSPSLAGRDSFSLLRKEMNEMLSNFWGGSPPVWTSSNHSLAVDLTEQENAFVMKVDIPGL